jgi:hypothetical protein
MKTPAALLDILYAMGVAQFNCIDSVSPALQVETSTTMAETRLGLHQSLYEYEVAARYAAYSP